METSYKWTAKLLTEKYFQKPDQKVQKIGKSFILLTLQKISLIDLKKIQIYQTYKKDDNIINLITKSIKIDSQIGHCYQCLGQKYIDKDLKQLDYIQKEIILMIQKQEKTKNNEQLNIYRVYNNSNQQSFNQKLYNNRNFQNNKTANSTIGDGNKTNSIRQSFDNHSKNHQNNQVFGVKNNYKQLNSFSHQKAIQRYNFANESTINKVNITQDQNSFRKFAQNIFMQQKQSSQIDNINTYIQKLINANTQFNEFSAKMKVQNKWRDTIKGVSCFKTILYAKVPKSSKTDYQQRQFIQQGQGSSIKQAKQKTSRIMLQKIYTSYPLLWKNYLDQKKKV